MLFSSKTKVLENKSNSVLFYQNIQDLLHDPLSTDYTTRERLKGQLILGHSAQEKELQGKPFLKVIGL